VTTYTSGRIDITARALTGVHHGASTAGNKQILRTEKVILDDGGTALVPFVSGNSLKHMIRDGAVRFALDVMAVPDASLSKQVVDLLFSGGHLSKGGQAVRLDKARQIERLFPALSMLGYSAGNFMTGSKLAVDSLHLVCRENRFRLPEHLQDHPHTKLDAWAFRDKAFGTRHEATRTPRVARMLVADDVASQETALAKKAGPKKVEGSSQMIYEFQVLKPGSLFWGTIRFRDLTEHELSALQSGLSYACQGKLGPKGFIFSVGAKSAIGYGQTSWEMSGSVRHVSVPDLEPSDALVPVAGNREEIEGAVSGYVEHLRSSREDILQKLEEVA